MNPPSSASPSIDFSLSSAQIPLGQLLGPYEGDLQKVRNLISERIFREEAFGDLLLTTGDLCGWRNWDHPDWLVRIVESNGQNLPASTPHRMAEHLVARGGKLYRATLILAIIRALSRAHPKAVTLAAALELIHLATLLHDDVIDDADIRRGKPSIPTLFDNAPAVLMGDHLYARAFEMLSECGVMRIVASTCRATSAMCRGEVEQLQWIGRHEIPEEVYFRLIQMKTAALIGCCTESASVLCHREEDADRWYQFGDTLGLVFQMTDDLLDFTSDTQTLGKQAGSDAADGKYTLPLILLRDRLGGGEALRRFLEGTSTPREIVEKLTDEGCLDKARERVLDLQKVCHRLLEQMRKGSDDHTAFEFLHGLVDFTGARNR